MNIDVYQSVKNRNKFISIPSGTDINAINLPEDVDKQLLELKTFKKNLQLDPNKPLIAMDPIEIMAAINDKGYAIHGTKIEVNIRG